jgi:glycerophosphoryl diester phosphodiesterase
MDRRGAGILSEAPIFIERNGHRAMLKWHRARRRAADPVFSGERILEGMRLGASVEIDLVVHADHGFAVLHDLDLGRESTGSGRVRDTSAATLRSLRLRDDSGAPTEQPVMLLEDIAALLGQGGLHPQALLQLDYKENQAALDPRTIADFAKSVRPVARHMILSSGDADSVAALAAAAPGIRIGHDPCLGAIAARVEQDHDYARFVSDALAEAPPAAEMIYLAHEAITDAERHGFDLIGAFHAAGKTVDAWTIRRVDEPSIKLVARLMQLKADQITTDDPEGLAAAFA